MWASRSIACGSREYSGSILLSDVPSPLRKLRTPAAYGGRARWSRRPAPNISPRARLNERARERASEREREREGEKERERERESVWYLRGDQCVARSLLTASFLKCVLLITLLSSNPCSVTPSTLAHATRMHREVPRRSSGAARKDSCTACERTVFTPCRRTHSAVNTRQWREEPTSTWPKRCQPVARSALQPPSARGRAKRWSKPPTTQRAATPSHPHSVRAAATCTPMPTGGNPAMQGLDSAAPSPRPRRHCGHPNARHP